MFWYCRNLCIHVPCEVIIAKFSVQFTSVWTRSSTDAIVSALQAYQYVYKIRAMFYKCLVSELRESRCLISPFGFLSFLVDYTWRDVCRHPCRPVTSRPQSLCSAISCLYRHVFVSRKCPATFKNWLHTHTSFKQKSSCP